MQVLDYSAGMPGALAIARAGYAGAVRYIGFAGRRKCTNRAEYEDFSRCGLGMALVYQDGTGDWLGGYAGGQAAARRAREHAAAIGMPGDIPVYMAIDRDIVTAQQFVQVMSYLGGAASVLGRDRTGVYGEHDVVKRALEEGHARYGWQTAAWSGGRRYAGAHLYQRVGQVPVAGIQCDVNDVLQADWGQHNAGDDDMSVLDEKMNRFSWDGKLSDRAGDALANAYSYAKTASTIQLPAVMAKLDAIQGALSDDEANIVAAVREVLAAVQAGGVDPAAFAAMVAPLIRAGATAEEVETAALAGIRRAFAQAAAATEGQAES